MFELLGELTDRYGEVLPISPLRAGITFRGERVPLLGPQGIFKPRIMELPLSITTSPKSPYQDAFTPEGMVRYQYRGPDPQHRENVPRPERLRPDRIALEKRYQSFLEAR